MKGLVKSVLTLFVLTQLTSLSAEQPTLKEQLSVTDYQQLFLSDGALYDDIWRDGKNLTALWDLLGDGETPLNLQFLIVEILLKEISPFPAEYRAVAGKAYAEALSFSSLMHPDWEQYKLPGNAWGFLFFNDDRGYLGDHLLEFGREAFPFLAILLDDRNPVVYFGSEEATIGASLHYEIRDLAAYYLAEITEYELDYKMDDAGHNDRAIEILKTKLEQGDPQLDPYYPFIRKINRLQNCTEEEEPVLLDEIWQLTDPENPGGAFRLALSVKDASGKEVAGRLSSSSGDLTAAITLYENSWEYSLTFTPHNKDNLYLLMRE